MRNIRLLVQYEGTDYSGRQVQPEGITRRGGIEEKIRKITGEDAKLIAVGSVGKKPRTVTVRGFYVLSIS